MRISWEDLARQFVLPLWTQKTLTVVDSFVSPSADIQTTFSKGLGPSVLKYSIEKIFNIFTSFEFIIHDSLQHENKFIYKWSGQVSHTNPILHIQPNKEKIIFSGITSLEMDGGLITRYHCFSDLPQILSHVKLTTSNEHLFNLFCNDINQIIHTIKHITGKRLTKREVECLSLWLRGFSIKETAKLLGHLSHRTVQTFRENIKRKLNVDSYQKLFNLIYKNGIMALLL